jgi:hypothetical protein
LRHDYCGNGRDSKQPRKEVIEGSVMSGDGLDGRLAMVSMAASRVSAKPCHSSVMSGDGG